MCFLTDAKSSETRTLHSVAEIEPQGVELNLPPAPKLATGHSQEQQEVIDYAWEISKGDKRFLYLLTTENGEYTYLRKHAKVKGSVGTDYGLCGVNGYYYSDLINDPRFFTDWKWQLEQCYDLYTSGTTFYGIRRFDNDSVYRQKIINKFQQ